MFETERCFVNTFQKSDYDDVKKLFVNQEVRKFLGGIRQENSIKVELDEMHNSSVDSFYWVVREKQEENFIGLVSLDPYHDDIHLEISYQFLPYWWGNGYATEVVQMIISFALNELNLSKVVAETQTANKPSCKLLERVGMKPERTIMRFGAEQAIYSIES
ncbi:GNAT family N-acetyltransferase [Aquisalibacillus elongatus]|uniref:Ribosomal-protein-alanine N-acetyltransferase n=1 Tax=Aquisalibacillus elongatus TaxID=485577 RepID=A0A3N5C7N5_9BACI|nr:GNAT family N-acetyltransferase [Aquisalibacillus elongatus]RPF55482.1 ribosomal-protein-alanine N-acetyltransferase [Aquisalibacillus elongatus]